MKISIDWLKDYVSLRSSPEELAERLSMAGLEVKGIHQDSAGKDHVLEIEITSNRPDWLSHVGVAREISALQGSRLLLPFWENKITRTTEKKLGIEIQNTALCPYYTACLLEDLEFDESPEFIKRRLCVVGMRPINLVVDVTNYVLLEMGQPLHAFDWDKLGKDKIVVRQAFSGEKIRALDDKEYSLDRQDLLIADRIHPIAVAGVMGGKESEVTRATRNILLESAYFAPVSVRRTSKRLGLVSESSYRFERGVDPRGVDEGRERAIHLIRKYAAKIGRISRVYQAGRRPVKETSVRFPIAELRRILGMEIPRIKISRYLNSLGMKVRPAGKEILKVQVPSFRQDISRSVDLIEEIARLHGYDRIPESIPLIRPIHWLDKASVETENRLRKVMLSAGFNESVTYSLVNEKIFEKVGYNLLNTTRIINPQNKELTLMRPTLISSLLEVVKTNFYHQMNAVKIFEVASVYGPEKNKNLPHEEQTLGIALSGVQAPHWLEKGRKYSLFDLKGALEEILRVLGIFNAEFLESQNAFLEQSYTVVIQGQVIGLLGIASEKVQVHYDISHQVFLAEISVEKLSGLCSLERKCQLLPKYPASFRDISVILNEEIGADAVTGLIQSLGHAAIKKVDVIDLYRGGQIPNGRKSMAFSIEYRSDDRTLTADEINQIHSQVVSAVEKRFQAELRR